MWFTQIQLKANGNQSALLRRTQQPEFVHRYLQQLANNPAYAGQQFKVLKMNVPEQWEGSLSFEVRSQEVGDTE